MGRAAVIVDLLAEVLHTSDASLVEILDALAGSQRVEDLGWLVRERRTPHERYPDRNAEIRQRHRSGSSYGQLALDYGISPSGIAKICQRERPRPGLEALLQKN